MRGTGDKKKMKKSVIRERNEQKKGRVKNEKCEKMRNRTHKEKIRIMEIR
jgi:hypothetical protein